tara:strand:+ start:537 stop:1472 length:936 start_codon:yes stop_codon:yes gene_type:complete
LAIFDPGSGGSSDFSGSRALGGDTTSASVRTAGVDYVSTLADFWRLYSDILWENGQHKSTCKLFIFEANDFLRSHSISEFDDATIDALVGYYRKKGNRNSTINRKLAAIFKLLKKAERGGHIARLPTYLRLRERNGRVRFLTSDEERRIFQSIGARNPHHELLAVFLIDTGARVGEALALKWGDIQNGNATFWITKSGRSRTIPLTERAQAALEACREFSRSAGPFLDIPYQNFKYNWDASKKECGLESDPNMVPHILRHTCASRLVQAGIDLRRVQTFLGHQTIQMTLRYAHLATNDLQQCARALNSLQH